MIELALPGGRVAFSTRQGGVSEGPYRSLNLGILTDDVAERVEENRRRAAEGCGPGLTSLATGWQVHGTEIKRWDEAVKGEELDRVDGHVTALRGLGLMVLAADCLPVALVSERRVAMLHCGWRGLADGLISRGLECFEGEKVVAAIGPGIGRCCYEVGEEVLGRFARMEGVAEGRMLDLKAVAALQLREGGVTRVEDVELCACCREDLFFSHRRDHGVTGRQGGFAWRE